jgi:hypothetical protein
MGPADFGHIEGMIAFNRRRREARVWTALKYLGATAAILLATGAVTVVFPPAGGGTPASADGVAGARAPSRLTVDLAHCPPLDDKSLPIVSFTITMRGDGTPEVQGCTRWQKRIQVKRQKNV